MRVHAIYLAVIALLIMVIVFAAAKAIRARRALRDIEDRFSLHDDLQASLPRKGPLRVLKTEELLRSRSYDEYRREVDTLVKKAQSLEEFGDRSQLSEACEAALSNGKRLRAIILLEVARAASVRRLKHSSGHLPVVPVDAAEAALFAEYVHAASLVLDDLPEFDDDAERRGRPALHVVVGPAVAQLAAVSLVAAGFQNICRQIDWIRENCPEFKNVDRIATQLCGEVSRALGVLGAAGGQAMDISSPERVLEALGPDASAEIARRKTASFFELSVVTGWLVAGGEPEQVPVLRDIGRLVGMAFQLADDLQDAEKDAQTAARRATEGRPASQWNFANTYGEVVAGRMIEQHLRGARLLLTQCGLWTPLWEKELFPLILGMAASAAAPPSAEPPPEVAAAPAPAVEAADL